MTVEQYHEHLKRQPKENKFGAKKVIIDGITFDSTWEGQRYQELKLLKSAKQIWNLKCHPKFTLQEENKETGDRAINYIADFCYNSSEESKVIFVVEDTKSKATLTPHAIDKHKIFRKKFPGVILRILFKPKNKKRGRPKL